MDSYSILSVSLAARGQKARNCVAPRKLGNLRKTGGNLKQTVRIHRTTTRKTSENEWNRQKTNEKISKRLGNLREPSDNEKKGIGNHKKIKRKPSEIYGKCL